MRGLATKKTKTDANKKYPGSKFNQKAIDNAEKNAVNVNVALDKKGNTPNATEEYLEEMRKKNPAQRTNLPEKLARVLTRVIGSEGLLVPEWQQVAICPGDVLLLCSDGVYGEMSEEELTKALGSASLQGALDFIRERVLAHGASDNFTALCLKVGATLPRAAVVEEWEREESDLLLRVAEERRDYGAK